MNLKDAIQNRHSVRSFSEKKIPDHIIFDIIRFAHLAPSAGNLQARDFIVVDDHEKKLQLSKAALDQDFIVEAPIALVICANLDRIAPYGKRGKELYCIQDTAAAVEHILLLAVEYGLGACWVGAFNEHEVSTILKLPTSIRPVALIPLGYPQGSIESSSRIDTKKLLHHNEW